METIGLIPAGGIASRLGKLPCSKEVFPLVGSDGSLQVLASRLIRCYRLAGIENMYFIIRKGKWDIVDYFGDGREMVVNIGYLIMNAPYGTPFTLNQAYPYIKDRIVAMGFPDIVFQPENAIVEIRERLGTGVADVVTGLVPHDQYASSDMVELDKGGKIERIVIKENRPDLRYSWFIAMWKPSFSAFMNAYVRHAESNNEVRVRKSDGSFREMYVGDVIQASLESGLKVDHVLFEDGYYEDNGTLSAIRSYYNK